ncbi:MnhB domain-containing protein [Echinicola jeungdonensis]|uniref:MnhB domain-containing protein n=1 Tax=Echinicola jeungdonensis TaxID=709343 RepID=A0ABV5J0H5_9BACT|nr:MnhB domain-containing protein [Echinicola jeungdonensis]MDN3671068.1 MnhB domain-containing protein [Echinicola jeungdonensis]
MKTLVLETLLKPLVPLFIVFALYMFFRGHNHPGGGFIAGLIAVIPLMIHAIAFSPNKTVAVYKVKPFFLATGGLLLAVISGMFSLIKGSVFMASLWPENEMPVFGKIGTPILFDLGVFLVVAGFVLKVTFLFAEKDQK